MVSRVTFVHSSLLWIWFLINYGRQGAQNFPICTDFYQYSILRVDRYMETRTTSLGSCLVQSQLLPSWVICDVDHLYKNRILRLLNLKDRCACIVWLESLQLTLREDCPGLGPTATLFKECCSLERFYTILWWKKYIGQFQNANSITINKWNTNYGNEMDKLNEIKIQCESNHVFHTVSLKQIPHCWVSFAHENKHNSVWPKRFFFLWAS